MTTQRQGRNSGRRHSGPGKSHWKVIYSCGLWLVDGEEEITTALVDTLSGPSVMHLKGRMNPCRLRGIVSDQRAVLLGARGLTVQPGLSVCVSQWLAAWDDCGNDDTPAGDVHSLS